MARCSRHSLPGATYPVMTRRNNSQSIFSSNDERSKFFPVYLYETLYIRKINNKIQLIDTTV